MLLKFYIAKFAYSFESHFCICLMNLQCHYVQMAPIQYKYQNLLDIWELQKQTFTCPMRKTFIMHKQWFAIQKMFGHLISAVGNKRFFVFIKK